METPTDQTISSQRSVERSRHTTSYRNPPVGGEIVAAPELLPGNTSAIVHNERGVFEGLPTSFVAGRYHSLMVDGSTMPGELEITATAEKDGTIMGLKHKVRPIYGVQFHPESVLTGEGKNLLQNFLNING